LYFEPISNDDLQPTETYPNAPITEALLDIQVVPSETTTLATLLQFQQAIADRFPVKQEQHLWKQELRLKPGESPQAESSGEVIGYFFLSPDRTKLAQALINSFTFHKLRPYQDWQTFQDEAKKLWEKYVNLANPTNVSRAALRYINRIDVPLPMKDFRDYCSLFPEIPPQMPQALAELFLRFVVPDTNSPSVGIVTATFEPPKPKDATLGLILDIDVFQQFAVLSPQSPDLWVAFERLREFKNQIFNSSTTEAAKNLFR
jgi:uncharacterized protein (TIGR04255 family)